MNANVDSLGDNVSCVKYIIGGMTFILLLFFIIIERKSSPFILYDTVFYLTVQSVQFF